VDESIPCPQCGAPARITERFWLGSTAGPVEHPKIGCVSHHWLTPLAETLAGAQPDHIPAAAQPAPPEPGSTETYSRSAMSSQVRGPLTAAGCCTEEMRGSSAVNRPLSRPDIRHRGASHRWIRAEMAVLGERARLRCEGSPLLTRKRCR